MLAKTASTCPILQCFFDVSPPSLDTGRNSRKFFGFSYRTKLWVLGFDFLKQVFLLMQELVHALLCPACSGRMKATFLFVLSLALAQEVLRLHNENVVRTVSLRVLGLACAYGHENFLGVWDQTRLCVSPLTCILN